MTTSTIPARVCVAAVEAVVEARAGQLARLLARDTRDPLLRRIRPQAADAKQEGRKARLASLREQVGRLRALYVALEGHGASLDAAAFGCLCAWAQGHHESIRDLEDRLRELQHPAAGRVEAMPADDLAGACEALLGGHRP